ncbi:MAG: SCO family protein [Hyphomicrobiaceae bacterium]|nr:SCO family protein [Hyphomicrobiaceae bacterium]
MRVRLVGLVAAGLIAGALAGIVIVPGAIDRLRPPVQVTSIGKAAVGGPFTLTDHTGRRVTDQDFRGRFMLVSFGFTFCPDVCPSGLQVMAAALDQLGPKAERITPIFISVDPERDTPEQLARYVPSFHPRLVGLTGTAEEIQSAAKAYRVYYRKVKDEKSTADYTIDHTSIIYLMDPQGEFVAHFTHATPVSTMAEKLAKVL